MLSKRVYLHGVRRLGLVAGARFRGEEDQARVGGHGALHLGRFVEGRLACGFRLLGLGLHLGLEHGLCFHRVLVQVQRWLHVQHRFL